ncbi:MAG TPA: hypothetical protein VLA93_21035 [Pyrinomonadaceae bacterium]|nr:hypothetical protein [Pyrinomonadaceae bacterium]
MKYLVIAAVVGLLFIFVYSRLRPYLQMVQKALNFLNDAQTSVNNASPARRTNSRAEHKLIRCESCGTWVPEDRALKVSGGLAQYCSRECLEKTAASKEHRAAG